MSTNNLDLSQKAVCTSMIISKFTGKKADKKVAQKIDEDYKTTRTAGKFSKDLFERKVLKPINRAYYEIRKNWKDKSLPWDEDNRIMPAALYEDFNGEHQRLCSRFWKVVDDFVAAYPSLLFEAEQELGPELFCRDDYPQITEIRDKFNINFSVSPIPAARDFRVSFSNEELNRVRAELEERNKAMLARSMHHAYERLHEVIKDMSERITKPGFKDTAITNIRKLVDILPELNLADDETLDGLRQEVVDRLLRYSPEDLKNDEGKRDEVMQAAGNIMRRIRLDL